MTLNIQTTRERKRRTFKIGRHLAALGKPSGVLRFQTDLATGPCPWGPRSEERGARHTHAQRCTLHGISETHGITIHIYMSIFTNELF